MVVGGAINNKKCHVSCHIWHRIHTYTKAVWECFSSEWLSVMSHYFKVLSLNEIYKEKGYYCHCWSMQPKRLRSITLFLDLCCIILGLFPVLLWTTEDSIVRLEVLSVKALCSENELSFFIFLVIFSMKKNNKIVFCSV